jgi:hypothetical protein
MKPVFHPSHSSWKSLRDSHIPNASTAGDILSSDRAWPAFIQNQSRFPRKGLVNSLPGTKRKSSAGALKHGAPRGPAPRHVCRGSM